MREEILEKIRQSSTQVNLGNMKITDDEIKEMIDTIYELKPSTSKFNLDNNNIGDKGARILAECLLKFDDVTELSMQFNNIGKEGAIDLFRIKKNFPNIDILFHGNKITNVGEMAEIEQLAAEQTGFKP